MPVLRVFPEKAIDRVDPRLTAGYNGYVGLKVSPANKLGRRRLTHAPARGIANPKDTMQWLL